MKFTFLWLLAIPCSWIGAQNSVKKDSVVQDESFDPHSLGDESWVIVKKKWDIKPYVDSAAIDSGLPSASKEAAVLGYRVQLFSSADYYEVIAKRNEAADKFTQEIYLDYEAPYYKLRLGNFTDKEKADELKNSVKSDGFPDAWVIQTKVVVGSTH